MEAQYLYSLPNRLNLGSMLANQDDKGSLQNTHWRSSTSSRKVWWLDNSRSQSPQWGKWTSKQSPRRSRGTRSSHSMDSVLSVQNKNFSGDGKEFKNVSRAVWKAKSQLHWQFVGIWQILWSIMESSYFDTRSIRDEWDCWESGTQNTARDVCSTVAILLGWKVVAWVYGMLLQSAKCSRPLGRRAKLLMKADLENHF